MLRTGRCRIRARLTRLGQLLPLGLGEHRAGFRADRPLAIDQAVAAVASEPLAPHPTVLVVLAQDKCWPSACSPREPVRAGVDISSGWRAQVLPQRCMVR